MSNLRRLPKSTTSSWTSIGTPSWGWASPKRSRGGYCRAGGRVGSRSPTGSFTASSAKVTSRPSRSSISEGITSDSAPGRLLVLATATPVATDPSFECVGSGYVQPSSSEIPYGQKIETIAESGDCLGRGVALRVVLRYFRVPHRRAADPRCMKLWYSACALSAKRSVFSLVREARFRVGPGDLEHPSLGTSMSRTKSGNKHLFLSGGSAVSWAGSRLLAISWQAYQG